VILLIRKYKVLCAFTLSLLMLAACGPAPSSGPVSSIPTAPEASEDVSAEETADDLIKREINVALLLPLTGPDARLGEALLNAASLALFDAKDGRLNLMPLDTRGTPDGTTAAVMQLAEKDVDIILGPVFAGNIRTVQSLLTETFPENTPLMIGFSTDERVAGNGTYLLSFRPEEQVRAVMDHASKEGYQKFAALIPETTYGDRILEVVSRYVSDHEKDFMALEFYPPDASQLFEPVRSIANYQERRQTYLDEVEFLESLGEDDDFGQELLDELKHKETIGEVEFEAILVPEGGDMLRTLAPLLPYYEVDPAKVKFLGTGLWDDERLFREPQLIGGWFAAPPKGMARAFLGRYEESYGQQAPRIATLAYDAMALVATIVRTRPDGKITDEDLTDVNGFVGVDGIFRFSPDGLSERGHTVYEINRQAFEIAGIPPASFIPPPPAPDPTEEFLLEDYLIADDLFPSLSDDADPLLEIPFQEEFPLEETPETLLKNDLSSDETPQD